MVSFEVLNQDGALVGTTRCGEFTVAILQLGTAPLDVYVIQLATVDNPRPVAVGLYNDIRQAAEACAALQEFSRNVRHESQSFIFPEDSEGISPLAITRIIDTPPKFRDEETL